MECWNMDTKTKIQIYIIDSCIFEIWIFIWWAVLDSNHDSLLKRQILYLLS